MFSSSGAKKASGEARPAWHCLPLEMQSHSCRPVSPSPSSTAMSTAPTCSCHPPSLLPSLCSPDSTMTLRSLPRPCPVTDTSRLPRSCVVRSCTRLDPRRSTLTVMALRRRAGGQVGGRVAVGVRRWSKVEGSGEGPATDGEHVPAGGAYPSRGGAASVARQRPPCPAQASPLTGRAALHKTRCAPAGPARSRQRGQARGVTN